MRGLPLWLTRRSWPRWQKRRRPRVRYHAVQVFPDGGWNAAQDLGSQPPTPHDRGHDGSEASGEDEGDESGLFSLGRRVSLVGQVGIWAFDELFDGKELPGWFLDQVEIFETEGVMALPWHTCLRT